MNQSVRLQTSSVQNQAQVVHDNITKAKNLMMNLKNSLENLFGAAHCEINNDEKNTEQKANFEKSFEEFCSIVDQIELNLTTALKCIQQAENSEKYLPLPVNLNPQVNSLSYSQFLNVTRAQIDYIEEIRSIFSSKE